MKDIFPIWWRVLAVGVALVYAYFGARITIMSWDVLIGEITNVRDIWRLAWWGFGIAGGAIGVVAVLVASHAIGVMQPHIREALRNCRPPPPPPYVKPPRHN